MRRHPSSTIYRYLDLPSIQIIQTHNSHRHNTTPLFQTLFQTLYTLPTYTSHTTATQTQTHVQHSPCSHRIDKAQTNPFIHSPPSPLTPTRAKHIHISYTPATPLIPRTTLIPCTSSALDTIPEPRVPLACPALTTTTPPPSPTTTFPSPAHPHTLTLSQHTHM